MTDRILPRARLADVGSKPANTEHGATPWRITYRHRPMDRGVAVVVDAHGNELFLCVSPDIAGRIVGAVNMVECAHKKADAQ